MEPPLTIDPQVQNLAVGLIEAQGVAIRPPEPAQVHECQRDVKGVIENGPEGGDERRQAVRTLLRLGGFKPSGRNKPAQEYLLRAAGAAGQWPLILNVVDVLNVVSLQSGLPISLLALDRLHVPLTIRYGRQGESFVFNQAGQELKVEGLICICQGAAEESEPVGTPVKDSLLGKVAVEDSHVLACIFAPRSAVAADQLQCWTDRLAAGFCKWCAPESIITTLVPGGW